MPLFICDLILDPDADITSICKQRKYEILFFLSSLNIYVCVCVCLYAYIFKFLIIYVCIHNFKFQFIFYFPQIIRQVSCGAVHAVALSEEGLVQAWGMFPSKLVEIAK